ncbi:uncharacterized protein LOC104903162 [Beta vulgaris subsp. vulgaris]|uniref:uncharacterized protein LOC104903162 n=1 Tax=Beta vulgaris subsp. vulgaris TaxID=3555 RepID=UPI002548BC75|nr:uncharacterized protein LOC104903162 [Beta vulgaris subsp. vulgaris]
MIKDLTKGSKYVFVKGRIIRTWVKPEHKKKKDENNKEEKISSIELILMDEQGDKIEISCRKNLIDTFKNLIKQGAFKEFHTFGVNENSGSARLQNDFIITLNYCSQISDSDESAIPEHGLNLVSFDDILSKKIPIVYYIDFIGEVTSYNPFTINDNSRFMTLELIDLEHRTITCVIWDMYADHFPAYASINGEKGPIIIVVQLGQRISYQGVVRVSISRYATRLFINEDIPEIKYFKQRRAALGEPSLSKKLSNVSTETNEFLKEEYIIDMCDLVESRKPGLYVCYGTIEDIDVELGWYYETCKICFSGINKKQDGGMRCKKENHIVKYPVPRYRVKIIVTDGTGDATFVLFDKEVRKFVDKSATELLKLHKKDDESFPEEFLVFLGKKLLFKVDLQYYYNYNQSLTFTVVNTTDDQDVIGKWMGMYIRMEDDRTVKKQIEAESVKEIDGAQATSTRDNESTPTSKTPLKRGLEDPNLLDLSCEDSKVDAQCSTSKKLKEVETN